MWEVWLTVGYMYISSSHMMSIVGHPFGIMEYYSGDWSDKGNLLLFMSDLQVNLLGGWGKVKKRQADVDYISLGFHIDECQKYAA